MARQADDGGDGRLIGPTTRPATRPDPRPRLGPLATRTVARLRRRRALVSLLVAIALTVAAFPEVVFLGGSLSPVGLSQTVDTKLRIETTPDIVPHLAKWGPRDRIPDVGASLWQLVPGTKFVHNSIADGESVFWNPYSAAGSYGPETLVDMKLSPFVLLVAGLGGSATAFTFALLLFLVASMYCLQQLFTKTLGQPRVAGVAACVVFLGGGWTTSYLIHAMAAPYLIFPMVLYTLVELLRRPGPTRLLIAVAAYVALLASTLVPSLVLMILLVHVVALTLDQWWRRDQDRHRTWVRRTTTLLGRQALVPAIGLLVTTPIWLPALIALGGGGGDIESYGRRVIETKPALEAVALLSPYAFESDLIGRRWTVTVGAMIIVLVVAALPRARGLVGRLLVVTTVVAAVAVTQHLGIPVARSLGNLPGLRAIKAEYWASLLCASLTLAVGCAVATARERGFSAKAGVATAGARRGGMSIAIAAKGLGEGRGQVAIVVALFWIVAALGFIVLAARHPDRRVLFAWLAVGALALELFGGQSHVRVKRIDFEDALPAYVMFLEANVGDGRVLNAGRNSLYPEWGAALGIRELGTWDTTQIPEYRDFFTRYINPGERDLFLQVGRDLDVGFTADPSALDLLSVRYIVVSPTLENFNRDVAARYPLAFVDERTGTKVYENPTAFPRAFLSPALNDEPSPDPSAAGWSMDTTSTQDRRLLDEAAAAGIPEQAAVAAAGTASITEDHHDRVSVEVDAGQPAILVLADTFQGDWKVTVDGEPAHLGRVDSTLRGVVVPEGGSTVVFTYESPSRQIGTLISLASLVALLAGASIWALRRRRSGMVVTSRSLKRAQDGLAAGTSDAISRGEIRAVQEGAGLGRGPFRSPNL
jgi:hypothetical protein